MSKTGPKMLKGKRYSIPEAPPDDPIYKRGFAIGVVRSTGSSKSTAEKTSPDSETAQEPSSDEK